MDGDKIYYADAVILHIIKMLDADSDLSREMRCNFAEFLAILDGIADDVQDANFDPLAELEAIEDLSDDDVDNETELVGHGVRRIDFVDNKPLYVVEVKSFTAYVAVVQNFLAVLLLHVSGTFDGEENEKAKKEATESLKLLQVRALNE